MFTFMYSYRTALIILAMGLLVSGVLVVRADNQLGSRVAALLHLPPPAPHGAERTSPALRHIYGNTHAPTTIVEFSDYQCQYCQALHATLTLLVDASKGTINWEFRQLPLSIHNNAKQAAYTAECIARKAGNDAFWRFTDTTFTQQNQLSPTYLETQAVSFGFSKATYSTCLASSSIADQVTTDTQAAIALGGNGTPFSVIEYPDGTQKTVNGSLPLVQWQQLLNQK